jgi:integrase
VVQVLALAERDRIIDASPARHAKRPKIVSEEIEILTEEQVKTLLGGLRGKSIWLIAAFALATGLRRGELLALRWKDVDLEGGTIQVERSLEQTKEDLRFKEPKTRHGRRQLTIPASIITELRAHRKQQAELRLSLGQGRDAEDALVFRRADGTPIPPDSLSSEWRCVVAGAKLPKVSLHALRHTHASQLIAAGLDVLTISRRLGHGSPSITLNVYSHLFKPTDKVAAAVFETAFGAVLSENIREPSGTK